MKQITALIIGSVLLLTNVHALAENNLYAGAAVGFSTFDYDDIDPGTATKIFIGFNVSDNMAIEGGFYDSGEADITPSPIIPPGTTISVDGINVKALYVTPASENRLRVMVGAGFYNFDTTVEGFGSVSDSSSGLSLHGGVHIPINDTISVRGDIDAFVGVEDFADDNTVISFHGGLILSF